MATHSVEDDAHILTGRPDRDVDEDLRLQRCIQGDLVHRHGANHVVAVEALTGEGQV